MIISFFGHSDFRETNEVELKISALLEKLVGDVPVQIYLGGYGAFDSFAYRCCKKYKSKHPNTSLIFITPYITPEYQKNHLQAISKSYDCIIYPEIEEKPLKFAISYRNKWMVDKSDVIIAYISRNFGGAYDAYAYAVKRNKTIFNIAE